MFVLFFYLYRSMFLGSWAMFDLSAVQTMLTNSFTQVIRVLTSIFGDGNHVIEDFGQVFNISDTINLTSFILALITSIGIVVMAAKGVKKAFGIFFGQIR